MSTTDGSSPTSRITSDILKKFYSNVKDLCSYLNDLLESSGSQVNLVNETDAQSYQELLNLSFVGVKELTYKKFTFYPPMLEMREVSCQRRESTNFWPNLVLNSCWTRPKNACLNASIPRTSLPLVTAVLVHLVTSLLNHHERFGQASHVSDYGKKGMARIGITNYFINTVVTAFQAPEWTTLLTRYVFWTVNRDNASHQ